MSKSFYFSVGPSEVYPEVEDYLKQAYQEGILSISHRSKRFDALSAETFALLHNRLNIPSNYTILFTSSATECWEILAQSLTQEASTHFYSGSFGEKWFQYAQKLRPASLGIDIGIENTPLPSDYPLLVAPELLCLTQNETSNGTQLTPEVLETWRAAYPESLIALDCTSSMAGIRFQWEVADIWYASVQKCFGLPAGLGLLILSPAAVERAKTIGENKHYNSLVTLLKHREKFQNSFTPNVLGIYLLNKVMHNAQHIDAIDVRAEHRAQTYYDWFEANTHLKPLIQNTAIRSTTVIAIKTTPKLLDQIYTDALRSDFQLGAGYGIWKPETFRIANFPAITQEAYECMLHFLDSWVAE